MVAYKSEVRHIEYDTINFYPTRYNRNVYLDEYKNFGDYFSMDILYDRHLGDTLVPENTDLVRNKIPEGRDSLLSSLVLSSLHIDVEKYRI